MGGYILPDGSKLQTTAYIEYLEARTEQLEKLVQEAVEEFEREADNGAAYPNYEGGYAGAMEDAAAYLRASLPAKGQGEQA